MVVAHGHFIRGLSRKSPESVCTDGQLFIFPKSRDATVKLTVRESI